MNTPMKMVKRLNASLALASEGVMTLPQISSRLRSRSCSTGRASEKAKRTTAMMLAWLGKRSAPHAIPNAEKTRERQNNVEPANGSRDSVEV